ncbi:MAG: hypothetical protein EBQ92_03415 [Proteobacteria bacterium]|nr:hypothetical protein [Pseudomonadota bacterium]
MRQTIFFLAIIFCFSLNCFAERSCGEAKIISGSSCSTLRIQFNLEACGGKKEEARLECNVDRANALVVTETHAYHIPVREIAPGVWTLVGSLREYPKKWRPEEKDRGSIVFRVNRTEEGGNSWPSVFEISGQFRFRIEDNKKNDFATQRGFSSIRARAGLFFHPSENVEFLLEPQAVHLFGEPLLQTATSNLNVSVGTSGVNQDPQLSFHRAYGQFRVSEVWRLFLGRQTFALGDEVLVGASDWENPGRSFDGIRSRIEWGKSSWDLFTTKLWDNNTQGAGSGDRDFHGTYLSWTHPDQNVTLSPYFFWLRDHRSQLSQLFTSGLHSRINLGEIEMRGEASGQWGETSGQQIWAELKSKAFSAMGIQVGVDGFWSGPDFNPLFPTTHKWLGWADVLGRRNLSGLGFSVGLTPFLNSELLLRGIHFLKTNTDFPAYQVDGVTPLNHLSGKEQALGSEVDLIFKSPILKAVDIVGGASLFFPSNSLRTTLSDSWVGRFEVSFISSF